MLEQRVNLQLMLTTDKKILSVILAVIPTMWYVRPTKAQTSLRISV